MATRMTAEVNGRPTWPRVPPAGQRRGRRLSARDQIQAFEEKPRDSHAFASHIPEPVVYQGRSRRRLPVDIVAIADERQRNDDKISTIIQPWVEKLFPVFDGIGEKRPRDIEMIAVGVHDREACVRLKFAKDQRRPREQASTNN